MNINLVFVDKREQLTSLERSKFQNSWRELHKINKQKHYSILPQSDLMRSAS